MDKKGLIFDIQGFSVHDGPGDRTLIFLSGCPLRCEWCANPEGKKLKQNLLFTSGRCKAVQNHCKSCVAACPRGAVTMDRSKGRSEGNALRLSIPEACRDLLFARM